MILSHCDERLDSSVVTTSNSVSNMFQIVVLDDVSLGTFLCENYSIYSYQMISYMKKITGKKR